MVLKDKALGRLGGLSLYPGAGTFELNFGSICSICKLTRIAGYLCEEALQRMDKRGLLLSVTVPSTD
jgi:hypothetical protein